MLARAYWARSHHPAVVAQDEELTLNRRMRWGDIRKILHTPQACSNQFVFCPGFPQALRICCLQYEFSRRRPGPFYHVMRAADIFLRHTQHIALQQISLCCRDKHKWSRKNLKQVMHMTDYNSKLKMKKTRGVGIQVRPSSMMWPRYLNTDVYYTAHVNTAACALSLQTLSTYAARTT